MGKPARWIKVIDTYNIKFQHRQGESTGTQMCFLGTLASSVGGRHEDMPQQGVLVVTQSSTYEPGWGPDELAKEQVDDPDIGPIARLKVEGKYSGKITHCKIKI